MAFLRNTVTGNITLPDGNPMPDGARIIFTLRSWDKDDDTVALPGGEIATVTDGAISVGLIRTGSTDRQVTYDVGYLYLNPGTRLPVKGYLGRIAIVGAGTKDLADLLSDAPLPDPSIPDALAQAIAAAESAMSAAAAANAAAYMALAGTGKGFDTVAQMLASTVVYGSNSITHNGQTASLTVAAGNRWRAAGFEYEVLASGAPTYRLITAGGVKLNVLRSADGWHLEAFTASLTGNMTALFNQVSALALDDTMHTPPGVLVFTGTINLNTARTTYEFGATEFDFTALTGSQNAVAFTPVQGGGQKAVTRVRGGIFIGPGYAAQPNTTGLYLHSASGHPNAVSNVEFGGMVIRGFGHARRIGNNAYIFGFHDCSFVACGTTLYSATGTLNSGENLTDYRCVHANGRRSVELNSQIWYRAYGCSFDYNTHADFVSNSGFISVFGGHWEWDNAAVAESKIITRASSATAPIVVRLDDVSQLVSDPSAWPSAIPPIAGQDRVLFTRCSLYGLGTTYIGPWNPNGGAVLMHEATVSTNPQVRSDLGPGQYSGYNWNLAAADVDGMGLYLDGTGVGARVSPIEMAGAKLSRTSWTAAPQSSSRALRLEKQFQNGADLTLFYLSRRQRQGEFQAIAFDYSDPDGTFAAQTYWYLTMTPVEVRGYGTDGVPQYGKVGTSSTFEIPAPRAAWQYYSSSMFEWKNRKTPDWATHIRWGFGLTPMVGATTGAAEDGGRRSIYLSGLRISVWGMA